MVDDLDMFEQEDAKDHARAYQRMQAMADELKAEQARLSKAEQEGDEKFRAELREASEKSILRAWKHLGREPVYTCGILLSPALIAYAERAAVEMRRAQHESQIRREKDAASEEQRRAIKPPPTTKPKGTKNGRVQRNRVD